MMENSKTKVWQKIRMYAGVGLLAASLFAAAGCGSSAPKTAPAAQAPAQSQPQTTAAAPANDENAFKASCQELEMRGLDKNYSQYVKKPVKADGPIMEVQALNDGRYRIKIKYPDTDAVWLTTEKALFKKPQVGKRAQFWGVLEGKGEKSKAAEVTAKYINIM